MLYISADKYSRSSQVALCYQCDGTLDKCLINRPVLFHFVTGGTFVVCQRRCPIHSKSRFADFTAFFQALKNIVFF
ncbi:hypothetical protein D3C81_1239090 [compost metagenome]